MLIVSLLADVACRNLMPINILFKQCDVIFTRFKIQNHYTLKGKKMPYF